MPAATPEQAVDPTIFTSTVRIHDDMPEFTVRRIVGDFVPEPSWDDIPHPREVSIIIEDGEGHVIQTITGLTQSDFHIRHNEIELTDLNFDGYLDMRLERHQDGAGGLLTYEYFWLWDVEASQFVLNEQLVEIGHAANTTVNPDTRQIVIFNRGDNLSRIVKFYEYHSGKFTLVFHELYLPKYDENDHWIHMEIISTDMITGEVMIEIEPSP
jgi:hypothetical protein